MPKATLFFLALFVTGLDGLTAGNNIFQDIPLKLSSEIYAPKDLIVSKSGRAQMVLAVKDSGRSRHALFAKSPQIGYFQLVITEEELLRESTDFLFASGGVTWVPNAFCSDLACYFSTFGPTNTASWKISFTDLVPKKVIYSGQATNLGRVAEAKSLFPSGNGDREFAKIKFDSGQEGYYELKNDGRLVLIVEAESGSRWAVPTNSSLIYTSITPAGGIRYLELRETDLITKKTTAFIRNGDNFDGSTVNQCCEIKASDQDFIFSYIRRDNGQAVAFYVDRDRKMTKIWDAGKNLGSFGMLTGNGPHVEFSYQFQHSYKGQSWTVAGLLNGANAIVSFPSPTSNNPKTILEGSDTLRIRLYTNPFETERGELLFIGEDSTSTSVKRGVHPVITGFSPKSFRVGDTMTLTGYNFSEPWFKTTVAVNGTIAPVHPADVKSNSVSFIMPEWFRYEDLTATVRITDNSTGIWAEDKLLMEKATLPAPLPPKIQDGGIVNAANFTASALAPGMWATIFGERLTFGSNSNSAKNFPLPTVLANTSVLINDRPAPLLYADERQINFQVPAELAVGPQATVKVITKISNGTILASQEKLINTSAASPALFEYLGQPIVTDIYGRLLPLKPLDDYYYLILWANGLGETLPTVPSGQPAPSEPLAVAKVTVVAKVGNDDAEVLFAGLSPGFAGLYQINIRFKPAGIPSNQGNIKIGSYSRNFNLTY